MDSGRDNLVTHANGSKHCHACGYHEGSGNHSSEDRVTTARIPTIEPGQFVNLSSRKISQKTCEKYGTTATRYTGYLGKEMLRDHPVVVFNWFKDASLVRQKIRDIQNSSRCTQKGDTTHLELFGSHAFTPNSEYFVIVTEGEFDALAVHEATGYAAVSITNGANNAAKELRENFEWLMKWKYVVLAFDNDEVGRKAADECAAILEPGKVRICFFPEKDANDMLKAGKEAELKQYLWNAKEIFPNDLVTAEDIEERIMEQPQRGPSWPWKDLTDITYGFHTGKVYILAGGTGIGKTEVVKELILHQIYENNTKCAMFSFEQAAEDTYRRLIGGRLNVPLHIPGNKVSRELIHKEVKNLSDKVYVFDRKASGEELLSFDLIVNKIKVLAKAKGVKLIVIDNLKSISATLQDKFHGIEQCMVKLQSVASAYDVTFLVVSHLAKDKKSAKAGQEDESWGRGRMPVLENIYGSSAIEAVADLVLVLARNADSEDPVDKLVTHVRCLKSRLDGTKRGKSFDLVYNDSKGRLEESII